MNRRCVRRVLGVGLALAAPLLAQGQTNPNQFGQLPIPPVPGSQAPGAAGNPQLGGAQVPPGWPGGARREPWTNEDILDPVWSRPNPGQPFQGFPVFPPQLPGFGTAPGAAGFGAYPSAGGAGVAPLRRAEPPPPGWPGWLKARDKAPLPFAPELALLVRHSDRVWWRSPEEPAFVPLYYHDKLRTLGPGSAVRVETTGEFELLLHDSGRLIGLGPTELELVQLDAAAVAVEVRQFTRLRLDGQRRQHELRLPDGSVLVLPGDAPEAPPAQGLLVLQRQEEPVWHRGRATLFNGGRRPLTWRTAAGERTLAPGEIATLFLAPPRPQHGAALASDVAVQVAGGRLVARAAQAGAVQWSGARFELPAGAELRLDPLLGDPFGAPPGLPPLPGR